MPNTETCPCGAHETLVTVHGSGEFTGEVNMLSGRRSLIRARAIKPCKVIELDHKQMLTLVQTNAELSDILMRAFILRRVELIAAGVGDIVIVGSAYSPYTAGRSISNISSIKRNSFLTILLYASTFPCKCG